MRTIVRADILDVVPYADGFIYIQSEELEDGSIRASFFAYEQEGNTIFPVKRKDYLQCKFGSGYARIAHHLGDFVFCESRSLNSKTRAVLSRKGDLRLFSPDGDILREDTLLYQGSPASSFVQGEQSLWCVVPAQNAVIHYSLLERRVLLRIGGASSNAFSSPSSLTRAGDKLYICSKKAHKIRTVSLDNYAVRDHVTFQEPVERYFRAADKEYVQLASGIYRL